MRVEWTDEFRDWLDGLRDRRAQVRIDARITRLEDNLLGQTRSLGAGLFELKIDYGPGYRVYFKHRGDVVVILLCGGDKSTQDRDIRRARTLMEDWNAP